MITSQDIIQNSRVIVMLGAGGVGKTTSAIVLALAAAKLGKRVALLSIDPAKRLAAALGIPLSNELATLSIPQEYGVTGSLAAAMLDQKAVFDQMVDRHAPSGDAARRIKAHPIYRAASTNLGGPLEYMALAKLQDLAADSRYDLVVLDTPPDTHALDFLARPNVLDGFMETKVMNWLVRPFLVAGRLGLGKLLSASERLMGGMAKVSGLEPLKQFAEFLVLMQDVIEGFHKSGESTTELLHRSSTHFILVSIPTHTARRSAENIAKQLRELNFKPELLLVNRCLPEAVTADLLDREQDHQLASYILKASGQKEVIDRLMGIAPNMWRLPEREHDPGDLAGLMELVAALSHQK